MRFHVVSLPHTQTTKEYSWCAYTEKVRKFCTMMTARGHEVYLYASEDNEAEVAEFITVISKKKQKELIEPEADNFNSTDERWTHMNGKAIAAIKKRAQPQDFLCLIAGTCQQAIAQAIPDMLAVEFGVGYEGVFSEYCVYESYAWMHTVYGSLRGAYAADGRFYDAVIPNYFEVEDFPYSAKTDDYYLYIGRLIDRKGFKLAEQVCQQMGVPLKIAGGGHGAIEYGEYVGVVGPEERGKLMSRAKAVFVPTLYLEPFGGVAVEAMLCGTPVITTDWGAFTETVQQGVTGYRCRTFAQFKQAAKDAPKLDRAAIRKYAKGRYSTAVIAKQYEEYFERLTTLWGRGFYT